MKAQLHKPVRALVPEHEHAKCEYTKAQLHEPERTLSSKHRRMNEGACLAICKSRRSDHRARCCQMISAFTCDECTNKCACWSRGMSHRAHCYQMIGAFKCDEYPNKCACWICCMNDVVKLLAQLQAAKAQIKAQLHKAVRALVPKHERMSTRNANERKRSCMSQSMRCRLSIGA